MAVVNQLSVLGEFAQRSLESDPVGPEILQQTLPPVRAFLDDLVELCFGYAIAPARLEEHLAAHTPVAKSLRYRLGQFLTLTGSALIDCDDRHDGYLLSFSQLASSRCRSHRTHSQCKVGGLSTLPYSALCAP